MDIEKAWKLCLFLTTGLPRPPNPKNVVPRQCWRLQLILDLEVSEEIEVVILWSRFSLKSLFVLCQCVVLLHNSFVLLGAKIIKFIDFVWK